MPTLLYLLPGLSSLVLDRQSARETESPQSAAGGWQRGTGGQLEKRESTAQPHQYPG